MVAVSKQIKRGALAECNWAPLILSMDMQSSLSSLPSKMQETRLVLDVLIPGEEW
jgi:hypothetical protein